MDLPCTHLCVKEVLSFNRNKPSLCHVHRLFNDSGFLSKSFPLGEVTCGPPSNHRTTSCARRAKQHLRLISSRSNNTSTGMVLFIRLLIEGFLKIEPRPKQNMFLPLIHAQRNRLNPMGFRLCHVLCCSSLVYAERPRDCNRSC